MGDPHLQPKQPGLGGRAQAEGLPGRGSRVATARLPHRPARSLFGEESGPICFHSESLKIPFWRNEKRKARFPRPARWVLARARRRAGGWGGAPPPSSFSFPPLPHHPLPTFLHSPLPLLSPSLPHPSPFPPLPLPRNPSPTPAVPQLLSPASRPGRAHLHGRHTRGPSAEAQLNAGGGRAPEISISAAIWREERARPDKGRRARGEASVPRH